MTRKFIHTVYLHPRLWGLELIFVHSRYSLNVFLNFLFPFSLEELSLWKFLIWQLYCLILLIIFDLFILFLELYGFLGVKKMSYLSFACFFSSHIESVSTYRELNKQLCFAWVFRDLTNMPHRKIKCFSNLWNYWKDFFFCMWLELVLLNNICRIGFHSFLNLCQHLSELRVIV